MFSSKDIRAFHSKQYMLCPIFVEKEEKEREGKKSGERERRREREGGGEERWTGRGGRETDLIVFHILKVFMSFDIEGMTKTWKASIAVIEI